METLWDLECSKAVQNSQFYDWLHFSITVLAWRRCEARVEREGLKGSVTQHSFIYLYDQKLFI